MGRKKINYNSLHILTVYRKKVFQIHRLGYFKNRLNQFKKEYELKNKKENPFLSIVFSSIEFSYFMIISKLFDEDDSAFSIFNIIKNLEISKHLDSKELKNIESELKSLYTWRNNVFAHDNFSVLMSSISFGSELHPKHLGEYYLPKLEQFLLNYLIELNFLFNKIDYINFEQAKEKLLLDLKEEEKGYEKELRQIIKV